MSGFTKARATTTIVAGFLADVATTPAHWVYDVSKLKGVLADANAVDAPEFFPNPFCPFYEAVTGKPSPYGGEYLALLNAVAETGATADNFNPKAVQQAFASFFKTWTGYKNHSVKTLQSNLASGVEYPESADKDDNQANGMVKAPIVAAIFANAGDKFSQLAADAARLTQTKDSAVNIAVASAVIIRNALKGAQVIEAIQQAKDDATIDDEVRALIADVLAQKDRNIDAAGKEWGISCAYPGAFKLALLICLQATSYTTAIRLNLLAGGDNCSRAVFIGGLFAAASPDEVPVEDWLKQSHDAAQVKRLTDKLFH